jgi:hypothetical protein
MALRPRSGTQSSPSLASSSVSSNERSRETIDGCGFLPQMNPPELCPARSNLSRIDPASTLVLLVLDLGCLGTTAAFKGAAADGSVSWIGSSRWKEKRKPANAEWLWFFVCDWPCTGNWRGFTAGDGGRLETNELNGADARRLICTGHPGRSQETLGAATGGSLADGGAGGDDVARDGDGGVGVVCAGLRRRYSGAGT